MLRSIAAQDKTCLSYAGKLFDLSYVLPNLIAMAFPATGFSQQWRNSRNDVAEFLKKNHPNHYKIWNLTEEQYDATPFDNNVVHCGFLDHHPPKFNFLLQIVNEIVNYLNEDQMNTAVIHCRAGRGRTGIVVCSVLLALGKAKNTEESLYLFGERRSKKKRGVTAPCQVRYVYYFDCYHRTFSEYIPIPQYMMRIVSIQTFGFQIGVSGYEDAAPIFYFNPLSHHNEHPPMLYIQQKLNEIDGKYTTIFPKNYMSGDIIIMVCFMSKGKINIIGRLMINTFFWENNVKYEYSLKQMQDATEGKNKNSFKLPDNYKIIIQTENIENNKENELLHDKIIHSLDVLHNIDSIVTRASINKQTTPQLITSPVPSYPVPPSLDMTFL
ncbi:phosphatidylinositol-3,4,5-trisphosphate 3-phosphatase [Entamoeba histolytica HM-3:IMSS]|uniref:Phosphatidylinositol3,4,5-trisphosphate 3-phosphatase, putative n=2 Tax=Entamoeba histolytica TaxID=5759 RepID=M2R2V5_ENTHI|nr:phosphatidylinositol3,4,5-trisphosphate 3-phosphatase, putative [Entamoeba histolytica KU27]EMS16776.1 phosphatidylinositol-3,4,5-trisphosphate 3-phosphatase [Entamoeba histolytica HM-3:IMSS]